MLQPLRVLQWRNHTTLRGRCCTSVYRKSILRKHCRPLSQDHVNQQNAEADHEVTVMNLTNAKRDLNIVQRVLGLRPAQEHDTLPWDACFVCLDIEAFEDDHSIITEIGIATLDTQETPDETYNDFPYWFAKIRSGHYRIIEHSRFKNRKYVKGREEHFNFGTTAWIRLEDAPKLVRRIFKNPSVVQDAAELDKEPDDVHRQIIFVGHGIRNDSKFLNKLGIRLDNTYNIVRSIDTQIAAGGTKKTQVGLQRLLQVLEIEASNLHNAGNDATYTLQALVAMAEEEHREPGVFFQALQEARSCRLSSPLRRVRTAPHVFAPGIDPTNASLSNSESSEAVTSHASEVGQRQKRSITEADSDEDTGSGKRLREQTFNRTVKTDTYEQPGNT
jgi:DNA polymerase III epsilon subunit-like protein